MSIGENMSNAWHKHPYIIMGVGGIIVLYFLWPSSSKSSGAPANNDYATQLASETALSQAQLAEQAHSNQAQFAASAAEIAASSAAIATSNSAIAQADAAAIISNDKTISTQVQGETALGIAQTTAGSTDFAALIAGLTSFGTQSIGGTSTAEAAGLNAYLSGMGTVYSTHNGDINTQGAPSPSYGRGGGYFNDLLGGSGSATATNYRTNNEFAASFLSDINASQTPFSANNNLLAGLWASMISSYTTKQATLPVSLPALPALPMPIVGQIQVVPGHA